MFSSDLFIPTVIFIALVLGLIAAIIKHFVADRQTPKVVKTFLDAEGNIIRLDLLKDKELYTLYTELNDRVTNDKKVLAEIKQSLEEVKKEITVRHLPFS